MPKFGKTSQARLATCHPDLQLLMNALIKHVDVSILCGHRTEAEQNKAYREGASTKKFPKSKHNQLPSLAVDLAPWPIDWKDRGRFYMVVGYVRRLADELGIKIRCGGDWDGDLNTDDQRLQDLPHIELVL